MRTWIAWVLLTAAAPGAFAIDAPLGRAGVHAGVTSGGDADDGELAYGARVEFTLAEVAGLELGFNNLQTTVAGEGFDLDHDARVLSVSLILGTPQDRALMAYALAGITYITSDADILSAPASFPAEGSSVELDETWGSYVGAGLRYRIGTEVECFIEYRFARVPVDAEATGPGDEEAGIEGPQVSFSADYDAGLILAGVSHRF